MNLLLLFAGFRVWSGSPVERLTRVFLALSLFALETQFITWTGAATLRTLVPVNALVALAFFAAGRAREARLTPETANEGARPKPGAAWLPFAVIGALVLFLNTALPLTAADPYHLQRVGHIEQSGGIGYDRAVEPKVNIFGWLYELALADVRALPLVGPAFVKHHGVLGLLLYAVACAAVRRILAPAAPALDARQRLLMSALLVAMPVVFHQMILVKNDLFGAVPVALVLAWIVGRSRSALPGEGAWAGWLTGLAIGIKLISLPAAVVLGAALAIEHRREAKMVAAAAIGGVAGLIAGGVFFIAIENERVYGAVLAPFDTLGNRTDGPVAAAASIGRFSISLIDLGLATRALWPGRGGWGGTFGVALLWSLAILIRARRDELAMRTLLVAGAYWLMFAAAYPDADIAHRLAIAPAMVVVTAAAMLSEHPAIPRWLSRLALPVVALSAAQIGRSAVLYLERM